MLQLDFDPQSVCRICLSADEKLGNLFLSTVVDGYIQSVPEMVLNCLEMVVVPTDGLPGKLCTKCKTELTDFYRFKQKSKRTDQVLRKMIAPPVETIVEECRKANGADVPAAKENGPNADADVLVVLPVLEEPIPTDPVDEEILPDVTPSRDCHECETTFDSMSLLQQHVLNEHTDRKINIKEEEQADSSDLLKILEGASEADEEPTADYVSFEVLYDDRDDRNDEADTVAAESIDESEPAHQIDAAHSPEMMDYEELEENSEAAEIFGCGECPEFFEFAAELEEHMSNVHASMKCENCEKEFTRELTFKRHVLLCKPKLLDENEEEDDDVTRSDMGSVNDGSEVESAFGCPKCNGIFESKRILRAHIRNSHPRANQVATLKMSIPPHCTVASCNGLLFKTQLQYDQHMKMHEHATVYNHYVTFYPCHTCRQIFEEAEQLKRHMTQEHKTHEADTDSIEDESCVDYQFLEEDGYEDGTYKCGSCADTFDSSNETKHHMVTAHLDKFTCPVDLCGCQYDQFVRFALHVNTKHINGNSHRCTHCDLELDSYDALQVHVRVECKERRFECTHCEKKFFSKKALSHHMVHIKGKRYSCQHCGKTFTQQGELTIHLRSHTGERPFVCTVCGKAYKTSSMRSAHMDTHIPGKTFSCPICSKMLQTRTSYRNHIKRHTESKRFSCQYCQKMFFTRYHVNLHVSKVHEKHGGQPADVAMYAMAASDEDDDTLADL